MNRFLCLVASVASMFLSSAFLSSANAQHEGHADVFVGRPALGTQTLIGAAHVPEELDTSERVFEAELGVDVIGGNNIYFATEPGFFNAGSQNLLGATNPAGSLPLIPGEATTLNTVPLTFGAATASLFYWDGMGEVNFVPTSMLLSVQPVESSADANGAIDDHPIFELDDPSSTALPVGGIYLAGLTATLTGIDASETIYLLMVTGEEFEEGVEAAEAFLAGVPEPATSVLALLATLAATTILRRSSR